MLILTKPKNFVKKPCSFTPFRLTNQNQISYRYNPELNKAVYEANAFLKKVNRHYKLDSHPKYDKEYQFLRRTILCAKLGGNIIPKILEENPDYEQFILKHHWHNAAVRYNQVLPVYCESIDNKEILSPS